jgi:hypothetical protein
MFIIPIIYTILNQNRQQIADSMKAQEPKKLSGAPWAFLSWALLEIILSCAYLQVQTQCITPKNGIKWRALFHYRVMKQQFHDSVIKYDSSIIPCFDIVVPHYLKVLFHSKYAVEKLILPPGRHNFDSSEPGTSWLENEIVVQALRLDRFKCNNISKYGTTQQHSKRKSGYSIVTVWHLVHDLYLNMYGTDQQPQHPHWHNQLAGGVVVRSDITQHIDFLSRDRQ